MTPQLYRKMDNRVALDSKITSSQASSSIALPATPGAYRSSFDAKRLPVMRVSFGREPSRTSLDMSGMRSSRDGSGELAPKQAGLNPHCEKSDINSYYYSSVSGGAVFPVEFLSH